MGTTAVRDLLYNVNHARVLYAALPGYVAQFIVVTMNYYSCRYILL